MASRVTITGIEAFGKFAVQSIRRLSEQHVEEMAKRSELVIKVFIQDSIFRESSTGFLEDAFFAEKTANGWGVGRISHLNQFVPYWRWQNFGVAGTGRSIPPSTDENPRIRGHFEPASNGRFVKGSPRFDIRPTKPIPAKNFIAKTLQQQNQIISNVFRSVRI